MNNRIYRGCVLFALTILLVSCSAVSDLNNGSSEESFSFAFLADIHLQPELSAAEGFRHTIDVVNRVGPDFVITGGDLVMDALGVTAGRADSLYDMYDKLSGSFKMPVYNTIGNHEIFGWYDKSGVDRSHPLFGKKMYEKRIGRRYYSFDFGGWHFIIIDSIDRSEDGGYIGRIGPDQLNWIREDLLHVEGDTPVALSTHIPILSVMPQLREGPQQGISPSEVVTNSRELLELFSEHNLKLVLQGHLHLLEEIRVRGITFITAGAVSGRWWRGPRHGVEEGFAMISVSGDEFEWEYVDSGWEAASD